MPPVAIESVGRSRDRRLPHPHPVGRCVRPCLDLAQAIGADFAPDPELALAALEWLVPFSPDLSSAGLFAEASDPGPNTDPFTREEFHCPPPTAVWSSTSAASSPHG